MSRRRLILIFLSAALAGASFATVSAQGSQDSLALSLYEEIVGLSRDEDFPRLEGPWQFALPDDLGAHPDARAETWAIAVNLHTATGEPVNLHLSLARLGLRAAAEGGAAFDLNAIHRGHVILIRGGSEPILAEERFSRGGGAAGEDAELGEVWLDDWRFSYSATRGAAELALSLPVGASPIQLWLAPVQRAIVQNPDGDAPLRGFIISRMTVRGRIGEAEVTGTAWLDRLWGEVPLPGGPLAYDRLVVHLDDGTDMSLLRTRRRDGAGIATLDGVIVDSSGEITPISDETVEVTVADTWRPDSSSKGYPVDWSIGGAGLDLTVAPIRDDTLHPFAAPIWSGGVRVEGRRDGKPVSGTGTLQLTGYGPP